MLSEVRAPGPVGRPRTRPDAVAGDKAYSSRGNRAHLHKRGIKAVIEGRSLSGSQVWTLSGSCMPGRRDFGGPLPPGEWGLCATGAASARGLR